MGSTGLNMAPLVLLLFVLANKIQASQLRNDYDYLIVPIPANLLANITGGIEDSGFDEDDVKVINDIHYDLEDEDDVDDILDDGDDYTMGASWKNKKTLTTTTQRTLKMSADEIQFFSNMKKKLGIGLSTPRMQSRSSQSRS